MMKIKNRLLALILLLFCLGTSVSAQEVIRLDGIVVEEKSGDPVPYATVRIKGIRIGTITNSNGRFSFRFSAKYANEKVVFSSIGYASKEISVGELNKEQANRVTMKISVQELADVTVISEKKMSALEVLRKAMTKIPDNYQNQQHTFDGYYRERIFENGAVIKYADAVVTFDQNPENGLRKNQGIGGAEWKSAIKYGSWLAGFGGLGRAADRLHDHFGRRTPEKDRVKIHEARISLNETRENLLASIEGGPLGTLGKDLVKYSAYFMNKKKIKDYTYELAEIPIGGGKWDYVVSFKPKRAPKKDGGNDEIVEGGIRKDIFAGEIYIGQEDFAIKKMNYRVAQKHRKHICSLGLMDIIHYGYQVSVNYRQNVDKWQVDRIKRVDEFLLPDTLTQKTTPYSAISEVFVTDPNSSLNSVSDTDNFANLNYNSLYNFESSYHQEFWRDYEKKVPLAKLSDSLRRDMEERMSLEEQFSIRQSRDRSSMPPVASQKPVERPGIGSSVVDNYQWMNSEESTSSLNELMVLLEQENAYLENHTSHLGPIQRDLIHELEVDFERFTKGDTNTNDPYKWAEFKKTALGELYHSMVIRIEGQNDKSIPVSIFFMGKGKTRWLKERPILISTSSVGKVNAQLELDASLMPLLNRGIIIAYVHLNGKTDLESVRSFDQRSDNAQDLIDAIHYLKKNDFCHIDKVFAHGKGVQASLIASAINNAPDLFQGVFLEQAELDMVNAMFDLNSAPIDEEMKQWNDQRKTTLLESVVKFSPYENVKAIEYPNMALFTNVKNQNYWQSAKMMAELRLNSTASTKLFLRTEFQNETDGTEATALKYALLFQWLDEVEAKTKK